MLAVCVETQATGLNDTKIFIIPAASNRFLLTQRKSVDESRVKGRRWNKKKKKQGAVGYNLLNTSKETLPNSSFAFRFSTHEALIEIGRVSIGRSIGARTRLSTVGSPLTKVSRWIFEKSTRSARVASFPLPPAPLSSSLFLLYTHARRNDETGRRLRESVFLAYYPFLRFPTVRKKNTRLGSWPMYRRYRPAALAVCDSHARPR